VQIRLRIDVGKWAKIANYASQMWKSGLIVHQHPNWKQ